MQFVSSNPLAKGLPPVVAFWGLWFWPGASRARLLAAVPVVVFAIFVSRMVTFVLPFRERPLRAEGFEVVLPGTYVDTLFAGWSAFPSDHATMFFALATCLWSVNRWVGALAFLHAALVVSLPRVFLGLHFPSDVIAGAIIGTGLAAALLPPSAWVVRRSDLIARFETAGAVLYPLLFLLTFQIATMFESAREMVEAVAFVLGIGG